LHVLVHARQDLVRNRTAHKNRLAAPGAQAAAPFLGKVVKALDGEIKAIEQAIKAEIRANKKLHKAVKLLRSVCGIGLITAAGLLVLMPELGTLNRRQIASLGGLAPHPRQSDTYRFVRGGRQEVKSVLFMAALSASRFHKTLRVFYQRLLALTAVMRKLLVICNALLREQLVPDAAADADTQTGPVIAGQTEASTASRPLSPPAAGVKPRRRETGRQRRRV
jgi:transposase